MEDRGVGFGWKGSDILVRGCRSGLRFIQNIYDIKMSFRKGTQFYRDSLVVNNSQMLYGP